ncbi:uncharacterized protein si:ch73-103b9.2 [Heptranchias perlo]|uniref:uncharacterized protein si:ch73-103b9.2 n=1 Tax=Heptranchias perlo TaxID=212740 RepID=UPI0035597066
MELHKENLVDSGKITFSDSRGGDNNVVISPTHFLHSWESERKLIDVLVRLSEEGYEEDQKQMDRFILCSGWDDAVQGWKRGTPYSSIHTLKKPKKSRKERKDSHCVLCTEMVPVSEKKAVRKVEHSKPSSKSSNSTMAYNCTGNTTTSSAERTLSTAPRTKLHPYSSIVSQKPISEVTQEIHIQEKTETEVNSSHKTECEIIHGPDQQAPIKKHFSVLPPVKVANGDETPASGFKPKETFCLGTQNDNQDLQTVKEVSESNNNDTTMCIRAHACNMTMLQVSRIQKAVNSVPVRITRIPFLHTMNHWCWQYSFMQGNKNLAIIGAPASKLMECHSMGVHPSKITKQHTKNLKQEDFSKSAFNHGGQSDKHLKRIRQRNVGGRDILPVIPQPGPPPSSGTRIAISILPHRLL